MYSVYLSSNERKELSVYMSGLLIALLIVGSAPTLLWAEENQQSTDNQEQTTENNEQQEEQGENNEEGDGGNDGSGSDQGATIVTGDADSHAETLNEVNTNEATTDNDVASTTSTETNTGSTTPLTVQSEGGEEVGTDTSTTTITNTNAATTTNNTTSEANTGDNNADGGDGNASVQTGDAFASANVINLINTNIFNANGIMLFFDRYFGGTFDIRGNTDNWEQGMGNGCSLDSCDGNQNVVINNSNDATIQNTTIVRSSTGGNTATSSGGNASVQTGNAYASANVVNVANTNLTNSNYLLLAMNNFGNMMGDIVLPGSSFFRQFFGAGGGTAGGSVTVSNENSANVENNTTAVADTGGNSASTTGDGAGGAVQTGNAQAGASSVNQVNTNFFDTNSIFLLLRVHGNWRGDVFGTPKGISWAETPFGIQVFGDGAQDEGGSQNEENAGNGIATDTTVTNTNNAKIKNNVEVYALTGDNKATGSTNATVNSGNAYASANTVNIANTNILGRNWILAIINIFGDWDGNLSFGRPDLWLGGGVESPDAPIEPGSEVTYHLTLTNNGDSPATNVKIEGDFNGPDLTFDTPLPWHIGDIPAGETKEISYKANVTGDVPIGSTAISSTLTATERETDENPDDNTEFLSFDVFNEAFNDGGERIRFTPDADISITKTSSATTTLNTPASVDYEITLTNNGGSAYHSTLVDTITGPNGNVVHEEEWNLGEIFPDEEISVTYTVDFGEDIPSGVYQNSARLYAIHGNPSLNPFYGWFIDKTIATSTVTVAEKKELQKEEEPVVEPIANRAPEACTAYLTGYVGEDAKNDPTVVGKLQQFLRDYEGFRDIQITGVYDEQTRKAIETFQKRYAKDILEPWGIEEETGFVYYTTQKKINELYCLARRKDAQFPLTQDQHAEINTFRSLLRALQESNRPVPSGQVGQADDTEELNTLTQGESTTEGNDPQTSTSSEQDTQPAKENEENNNQAQTATANVANAASQNMIAQATSTVREAVMQTVYTLTGWFLR